MPQHTKPTTINGFNLAEFRAHVDQSSVLKPTKWLFETPVPNGLIAAANPEIMDAARTIKFWATAATIPGVILIAQDIMRYGYGPAVKYPFSPAFGPMQITFIADGLGSQWKFFKEWTNLIIYYNNSKGIQSLNPSAATQAVYEVGYPSDYVVDANVTCFVDNGEQILKLTLREAFPVAVSDMRMDWNDIGGPAIFNVSMQYSDWFLNDNNVNP